MRIDHIALTDRLLDWLGPNHLPVREVQDERVLVRCGIRTERGEVILG